MKATAPDTKAGKKYPSLLDIKLGTILGISNGDVQCLYILAGMSLTGYALVSIYHEINICNFLSSSGDIPARPITLTIHNTSVNTYADCSRIITCKFGVISTIIKERPACYVGQLNESETEQVIQMIKETPTIAQNLKGKYFI